MRFEHLTTSQKREFAKFAYLYIYGGLFADSAYAALQTHDSLFTGLYKDNNGAHSYFIVAKSLIGIHNFASDALS